MIMPMKQFVSWIFALQLTFLSATTAPNADPLESYLVLHTSSGDLVAELYPDAAPRTVSQISNLVKAGIYDSTPFFRLESNFVLQTAIVQSRLLPLSPMQCALLRKIPAEFNNIKHQRGVLSLARDDHDPDSGESSFSILLADAPHLDGQYTIFGRLVGGWNTLELIESMPRNSRHQPETRIEILTAEMVANIPKQPEKLVLTASALPQNDCPRSCLASRQWSFAPDKNFEEPPGQIPNFSSCLGMPIFESPHE